MAEEREERTYEVVSYDFGQHVFPHHAQVALSDRRKRLKNLKSKSAAQSEFRDRSEAAGVKGVPNTNEPPPSVQTPDPLSCLTGWLDSIGTGNAAQLMLPCGQQQQLLLPIPTQLEQRPPCSHADTPLVVAKHAAAAAAPFE